MPSRILKESICTSETIDQLSPEEEVLFYRLMVNCDDYGRMHGRLSIVRAKCFPLRLNKVSDADIGRWLNGLVRQGLVRLYTAEGIDYIQMVTFEKHQQVRAKKSKFPSPPPSDGIGYQLISEEIIGKQMSPYSYSYSYSYSESESNPNSESPRAREEPADSFLTQPPPSDHCTPTETPDDTPDVDREDDPPPEETETVCAAGRSPDGTNGEAEQELQPPDPWDRSTWDHAARVPPVVWRDLDAMDGLDLEKQLDKLVNAFNSRYKEQHKRYGAGGSKKARDIFRQCITDGYSAHDLFIEIVFDDGTEERPPWNIVEAVTSITGLGHTNSMTLHGMLDQDRRIGIKEYGADGAEGNAQSCGH